MVVAEIELGQVPMQVLLAGVLIDPLRAALEDREHAFDRVRMNRAADVPCTECFTVSWLATCDRISL